MTREELLAELEASRERFLELIDDIKDEDFEEPGVSGDWTLKDILAHLTRWEAELIKLLWQTSRGQEPTSAQLSKTSVDDLNDKWYIEMRSRHLSTILDDFHSVRNQTMRRVEDFSDRELNDDKRYPWLDGQPLWIWVATDSYEHESEHLAQIKNWRDKRP